MAKKRVFKKAELAKKEAQRMAEILGCSGLHQDKDGNWMPCASHEELQKISNEAESYEAFNKNKDWGYGGKSARYRRTRRGKKARRRGDNWEDLEERGPISIDTLPGGGLVSGSTPPTSGAKSALGRSIGERANGLSPSRSSSGVDRDGDGVIDDGTENERPAPKSKKPAPGTERGAAEGKRPLPPPTPPKKRKRQIVYAGGRRYSRSLMPLGPDPQNYPEDEYELVTPEGKPYDRSKKPHQQGKSLDDNGPETKAEQRVGPEYVRDNDPDVFIDPESARFRSRQLGCIGISRRISKTGRAVWMPCTNMSDYARVAGATPLGRRGRAAEFERSVRTIVSRELDKRKRKTDNYLHIKVGNLSSSTNKCKSLLFLFDRAGC